MCLRVCCATSFLISVVVFLIVLIIGYPRLNEIIDERSLFLQNQFRLNNIWSKQPLRQEHKFYFYNIKNGEEFLRYDVPMIVDEIGPFSYDCLDPNDLQLNGFGYMRPLSLENLRFNLDESAANDSSFVYTVNIPLIRNLFFNEYKGESQSSFLKLLGKDFVYKTTVRELLGEIIDGYSLKTQLVLTHESILETREKNNARSIFNELHYDTDSNYLQYLRNEVCLRLFRVIRFVNPSIFKDHKFSRLFEKLPCHCLTISPNGTEIIHRTEPEVFNIRTNKYFIQWNDEVCSRDLNGTFFWIQHDRYVAENLFSVSSPAFWRDGSYIQYQSKQENSPSPDKLNQLNVEPKLDLIAKFSFKYQFNIPIKFSDESSSLDKVNVYPILTAVIEGVSEEEIDASIYRYIVFPRIFVNQIAPKLLFLVICISISITTALFIWVLSKIRRSNPEETTPLLRRAMEIAI